MSEEIKRNVIKILFNNGVTLKFDGFADEQVENLFEGVQSGNCTGANAGLAVNYEDISCAWVVIDE